MNSKAIDGVARVSIEGVEVIHHAYENSMFSSAPPVGETADRLLAMDARIELPFELSCGRIERDDLLRWRNCVKHSVDDQGIGQHVTCLTGIEAPGDRKVS